MDFYNFIFFIKVLHQDSPCSGRVGFCFRQPRAEVPAGTWSPSTSVLWDPSSCYSMKSCTGEKPSVFIEEENRLVCMLRPLRSGKKETSEERWMIAQQRWRFPFLLLCVVWRLVFFFGFIFIFLATTVLDFLSKLWVWNQGLRKTICLTIF